jgi:hypothetical protein
MAAFAILVASMASSYSIAADLPQKSAGAEMSGSRPQSASAPSESASAGSAAFGEQRAILGAQIAQAGDNGAPNDPIWIKGRMPKPDQSRHQRIELSLGDFVILRLNAPLQVHLHEGKIGHRIGLYINDLSFKDLAPMEVPGRDRAVMFQLKRTEENQELWSRLFARKGFGGDGKSSCESDAKDGIRLTVAYEDGTQVGPEAAACLEYFPDFFTTTVWLLLGSIVLIVATIVLAVKSDMLRDAGLKPVDGDATWSLARCQMALWFVTVVAGTLFMYSVTGDISPVPQGALILMGFGAGTAVGSFAIDVGSISAADRATYASLKDSWLSLTREADALKSRISAAVVDDSKATLTPSLNALLVRVGTVREQLRPLESPKSAGFFRDILSDGGGIALHRLQVFAWTLSYWFMFAAALLHKITMIDFTASQLALMGISGATYLGFKFQAPVKQSDSNAGSILPKVDGRADNANSNANVPPN